MPDYQYVAQNEEGKSLKGILRSDNERAARQEIKSKNLLLLKIRETSKGAKGKKIARKDVAIATRQISSLIGSGIPLDKALQSIGKNSNSKIFSNLGPIGVKAQSAIIAQLRAVGCRALRSGRSCRMESTRWRSSRSRPRATPRYWRGSLGLRS